MHSILFVFFLIIKKLFCFIFLLFKCYHSDKDQEDENRFIYGKEKTKMSKKCSTEKKFDKRNERFLVFKENFQLDNGGLKFY